ncbi:MAG: gliding motility lipoprotein GldH [Bacteroidales bacterium]
MRETRSSLLTLSAFIMLITLSCDRGTYYAHTVKMEGEAWSMYDPGKFTCTIDDTVSVYNIDLSVRTSTQYPYRNLYLFVVTSFPSGNNITDTVQVMLADEKGDWLGRGAGDLRELTIPYKSNVYFPEKGEYHFKVIQGMRDTVLKGVYDLGMRISLKEK